MTTLDVRPKRIRRYLLPVSALVMVVAVIAGLRLPDSPTGVHFTITDQIAIIGLGLLVAAGIMLPLRPRVRADARHVQVRGLVGTKDVPWSAVRAVSFPDGAYWARLELDADEYVALMAIQSTDGERAVAAIRDLRALHREAKSD
jgi:hypothetical protein